LNVLVRRPASGSASPLTLARRTARIRSRARPWGERDDVSSRSALTPADLPRQRPHTRRETALRPRASMCRA
jgi:hypothetical protein